MEDTSRKISARNLPMSFVLELHKVMEENNIFMVYEGDFSQEVTKTVLHFTERKFLADNLEDTTRRKIFNVMVESLQNISKHSVSGLGDESTTASVFMIGYTNNNYLVISGNPILNHVIPKLKDMLDKINSLDKDGLKQLYKETRLNSTFSEVGGAGMGLIDMARKSGNKLNYRFDKINDKISFYSLIAKITKIESTNN